MERNRLTDYVEEHYPDYTDKILLADGLEDAFIGVVESFYNYDACISILMEGDAMNGEPQMTYDEAVEYMDFNVTGAYVGEYTPAFIMNLALGEQKL